MGNKYFIQIVGANSVGKSTLAYNLTQLYKDNMATVGKPYAISLRDGKVKGGVDPIKETNLNRRKLLKLLWLSDVDIVLMLGMIITSKLNILYYLELNKLYKRNILILHLFADNLTIIYPRLFLRSGGKEMTKKRKDSIKAISTKSKSVANYAKLLGLDVILFLIKNDNSINLILNILKENFKIGD